MEAVNLTKEKEYGKYSNDPDVMSKLIRIIMNLALTLTAITLSVFTVRLAVTTHEQLQAESTRSAIEQRISGEDSVENTNSGASDNKDDWDNNDLILVGYMLIFAAGLEIMAIKTS